jgi:hypothetical protein
MNETPQPVPVPRRALWWWTLLLVAPWVLLAVTLGPQWVRQTMQSWGVKKKGDGRIHYCKPGPWGELEFVRIVIEPPEAYVAMSFDLAKKIQWFLRGYTAESLTKLWTEAGLAAADQQALSASARWDNAAGTVVIEPPHELILNLSPASRARIYKALGDFAENHLQAHPYRFRADVVGEWLAGSDLSDRTGQLIRKMLYPRGTSMLFADQDVLLPMLETAKERARAIKTLSRISTLLVKLRVRPNTDIDALAAYWGRGRRAKDIGPLLESLPKQRDGFLIDVAHLLTGFARRRLYTYPNPDADPNTPREDCHWTSFNFFAEIPDNRLLSTDYVRQVIEKDYYPVLGEPTFGDVLFLMAPKGEVVHSCVYIADQIVFTKNGPEPYIPWKLMEMADMRAVYASEQSLEMRIYRHKEW